MSVCAVLGGSDPFPDQRNSHPEKLSVYLTGRPAEAITLEWVVKNVSCPLIGHNWILPAEVMNTEGNFCFPIVKHMSWHRTAKSTYIHLCLSVLPSRTLQPSGTSLWPLLKKLCLDAYKLTCYHIGSVLSSTCKVRSACSIPAPWYLSSICGYKCDGDHSKTYGLCSAEANESKTLQRAPLGCLLEPSGGLSELFWWSNISTSSCARLPFLAMLYDIHRH